MDRNMLLWDGHDRLFTLLQTNYYPTQLEEASLNDAISKYEEESKQLDQSVADLRAQIVDSKARKVKVTLMLKTAKGVLAPIRRIPEEVLGEVFYWCTQTPALSSDNFFTSWPGWEIPIPSTDAPFSLLRVCHLWRRITLRTPKLFTGIYLPFDYKSDKYGSPLMLGRMYLSQSGTLPLEVYVDPARWWWTSDAQTFRLFGKFRDHIHRITTLVTSLGPHIRALFPEGTTIELPNLRRLKFIEKRDVPADLRIGQLIAKGLRMVDLGNFPCRLKFLRFGENLKYFRIGYDGCLEPSTLVDLFRQDYPNLKSLDLHYEELVGAAPSIVPPEPIYLPKLTKFTLRWKNSVPNQPNAEILQHVLSNFRTPKLKSFDMSLRSLSTVGDILSAILEWFRASKCDLRDLKIRFGLTRIDHDGFNDLLKLLPNLSNLSFSGHFSKELILLLNRQDHPELCPNLTIFDIWCSDIYLSSTLTMIHSRASKPSDDDKGGLKLLEWFRMAWSNCLDEDGTLIEKGKAADLLHDEFIDIYPQLTIYTK